MVSLAGGAGGTPDTQNVKGGNATKVVFLFGPLAWILTVVDVLTPGLLGEG